MLCGCWAAAGALAGPTWAALVVELASWFSCSGEAGQERGGGFRGDSRVGKEAGLLVPGGQKAGSWELWLLPSGRQLPFP